MLHSAFIWLFCASCSASGRYKTTRLLPTIDTPASFLRPPPVPYPHLPSTSLFEPLRTPAMRLLSALVAIVASGPLVAATGMTLAVSCSIHRTFIWRSFSSARFLQTLESGFSGIVSQPGDPAYDITRPNIPSELPAAFVIYPATPADVGKSLQFVSSNGYDLAVKSGGHGSTGSSSSLHGVVIDMSKFFTNITVNSAAQTATVEVGVQVNQLELVTMQYGSSSPVMVQAVPNSICS